MQCALFLDEIKMLSDMNEKYVQYEVNENCN